MAGSGSHQNFIEIPGPNKALVFDSRVAIAALQAKFMLLEARVGSHAFQRILMRQFEHAGIQRVETGQSDELELVSHFAQLLLEAGDGLIVQVAAPVEGW